jgi:hypothetical protein
MRDGAFLFNRLIGLKLYFGQLLIVVSIFVDSASWPH